MIAVSLELVMGIAAIATGATMVGLVVCASMAACMWLYALSEIVAFYRVGLPQPDPLQFEAIPVVGEQEMTTHELPRQAVWQ